MADRFKPQEFDINSINGGVRYRNGYGIQADSINSAIEAAAFVQALATNQPDTTNANNVGTPTVSIQKTVDGTPQLKFENLKGIAGAKGDSYPFSYYADEAEKAKGYVKGGAIDKAFKDIKNKQALPYSFFSDEAEKAKGFSKGGEIDKALNAINKKFQKGINALKQRFSEEIEQLLYATLNVGEGGSNIEIEQTTGQSTTSVMSQKAVTDELQVLSDKAHEVDGKADTLTAEIAVINVALEQSGLLKKYKQPIEQEYNERVTADGANVLDGSKAKLEKVVGNTVKCNNLFNISDGGIVKNARVSVSTGGVYSAEGYSVSGYTAVGGASQIVISGANTQTATYFAFYDKTKTFVSGEYKNDGTAISVPTNAHYLRFDFVSTATAVMVNEGSTALPYQPYFTGLKSASFAGIESTNADGTETSTLTFPKTPTPLGVTIDFENKKITDYGFEVVLKGTEKWNWYGYQNTRNGAVMDTGPSYPRCNPTLKGISTDSDNVGTISLIVTAANGIWINMPSNIIWNDILDRLGYTTAGAYATDEEQTTAITNFKSWLAQRYADGNPVTIRYVASDVQSETDFTESNEYTAYKGGTEKVLDNDGNEYGADNTLTQDYILVTEV